jgi:hypothetical protein
MGSFSEIISGYYTGIKIYKGASEQGDGKKNAGEIQKHELPERP